MKPKIYVEIYNGFLLPKEGSSMLFDHLHPKTGDDYRNLYAEALPELRALAEAHGWEVELVTRKKK